MKEIMLTLQEIKYIHPDKELLFENISLSVNKQEKVALVGNNGSGKSTLLKLIAGLLTPAQGFIRSNSQPYYVPQHFGQYNNFTVAGALNIENRLKALNEILIGNVTEANLDIVNDDWLIEERSHEALSFWELHDLPLTQKMERLSGGEKTKVFLAGISIHKPEIVLLDEPTNHLDTQSREILYNYIQLCNDTLIVVSHDRLLLRLLNSVYKLDKRGITLYGGNYDFYIEQKEVEEKALLLRFNEKEKELQKARKVERKSIERKQRQDVRGKGKLGKERMPRIYARQLKNKAESTASKLKETHSAKISIIRDELRLARQNLPDIRKMKMDYENSKLHTGKILVRAQNINFRYDKQLLWSNLMSFQIRSGERINIKGKNGSGKTTLIKIIIGEYQPTIGTINRSVFKAIYFDQDYSLINDNLTIYEQAWQYNDGALQEHDIRIRLNRYLFGKEFLEKPCNTLSGGEKMRLSLCCLMITNHAPDLFVLDEPTNNLDIQNIGILTTAINEYKGTVIVVSHDNCFLSEINVGRTIEII